MKLAVLTRVMFTFIAFAGFSAQAGGDAVNNGGGLSEQSLMYASLHFNKLADTCLQYSTCGSQDPLKSKLLAVKTCEVPQTSQIKFQEDLAANAVFILDNNHTLNINRKKLYTSSLQSLKVPEAFAFLARIYFEICDQGVFVSTEEVARPLEKLAIQQGEQVTIGKDTISLPATQWIRARTMYSDLLIEAPEMLVRLSCEEERLSSCHLLEKSKDTANTKFRNLTLRSESKVNDIIRFNIEGYFVTSFGKEKFSLSVDSEKGKIIKFTLQGAELKIP